MLFTLNFVPNCPYEVCDYGTACGYKGVEECLTLKSTGTGILESGL